MLYLTSNNQYYCVEENGEQSWSTEKTDATLFLDNSLLDLINMVDSSEIGRVLIVSTLGSIIYDNKALSDRIDKFLN